MRFHAAIPILAVNSVESVHEFYTAIFGETDIEPEAGIAEWEVSAGHHVQVAEIPERAGQGAVVVGTRDVQSLVDELRARNLPVTDVEDYSFVKVAVAVDPDGNEIQFAEDVDTAED